MKLNLEVAIIMCKMSSIDPQTKKWAKVDKEEFIMEYKNIMKRTQNSIDERQSNETKEQLRKELNRREKILEKIESIEKWDEFASKILNKEYYIGSSRELFSEELGEKD